MMRPILNGDVSNAARVLFKVPADLRSRLISRLICEAEIADAYVRRTGRLHPFWGNGSLMSAARKRELADDPGFDNNEYCQCFEAVLQALVNHRVSQRRN